MESQKLPKQFLMFCLVQQIKDTSDKMYLYDSEDLKDLDLKDLGFELIQENPSEVLDYPIYSLNDILITALIHKSTTSSKLDALHLSTFSQINAEVNAINAKQSRLSRSQRELVQKRFEEICKYKTF